MKTPFLPPKPLSVTIALLLSASALAQANTGTIESSFLEPTTVEYQTGNELLVLPNLSSTEHIVETDSQDLHIQTSIVDELRVYELLHEGKTYRIQTPITGYRSRVAFDVKRKKFVALLPSIRVKLTDRMEIDAIAKSVGATDLWVFQKLGFAIMQLPFSVHPAQAVDLVKNMSPQSKAFVRLYRPPVKWR